MIKKKGFTLAETVITLGIVGLLAMVMFPSMMASRPNVEMVMLKKAYYNTTRIVSELINDEDFYPESLNIANAGFAHINIAGVAGHEATYHGIEYAGNSKFCGLFAAKLSNADNPLNLCSDGRVSLADGGNFRTADGTAWSMPSGNFDGDEAIGVDVNGPDKGDNCSIDPGAAAAGASVCEPSNTPDQFVINVGKFGNVTLPGPLARLYVNSQSNTKKYQEFLAEIPDSEKPASWSEESGSTSSSTPVAGGKGKTDGGSDIEKTMLSPKTKGVE